jgi:hypothetical protein
LTLQTIYDKFTFCSRDYETQLEYFRKGLAGFQHTAFDHPLILTHHNQIYQNIQEYAREPLLLEFYETEYEVQFGITVEKAL